MCDVREDGKIDKLCSVERLYEMIVQRFDQLGNQTTLTESNFRIDDKVPKVPHENPKIDNLNSVDDESLAQVDLEEGSSDYDGLVVVVNRIADDKLSEEIAAPNCCAICLEKYSQGEQVVWSANEKCHHFYHKGCIAACCAHAKKKGKKTFECPTCRQEFLVLSDEYTCRDETDRTTGLPAAVMLRTRQQQIWGRRI
jgi:hypothetical protein